MRGSSLRVDARRLIPVLQSARFFDRFRGAALRGGSARRCPLTCVITRAKLRELVGLVDSGVLTLEVTRRIPLTELTALHAEAAEGRIAGKVIVIP